MASAVRAEDWISLNDAALTVYRALFSHEDERKAVDRIRKVIKYAAGRGALKPEFRANREGYPRKGFELWAAKRYPGSIRGTINVTGTARVAFNAHRAEIRFDPLPPEVLNMPADMQHLQDMVRDYWGRTCVLQRKLDKANERIAELLAEREQVRARDATRRRAAQAAGRKGGRPRNL